MVSAIATVIPPDVFKLCLVVFLSFLIGLEREEQKSEPGRYVFGGVRTYPLIGLLGYGLAFLANQDRLPVAVGLFVVGGFMMLSYWNKIRRSTQEAGLTTEMTALGTYLVGPLVYYEHYWVACTFVITSLILLELKSVLEGLVHRFSPDDILTLGKFLFLTIVVLPILPNQSFSPFEINPFKTWLVVVAVSTVSYASFLLQRVTQGRGGLAILALLGGAYSSTVTTVALAKKSAQDPYPQRYPGAILMASGVMYLRFAFLLYLFNPPLARSLLIPLLVLAAIGVSVGWFWLTRQDSTTVTTHSTASHEVTQNPLELKSAFLFALLFVVIAVVTHYTSTYLGDRGLYGLAAILGVTDVDPFILGLTQSAGKMTALPVASAAILIAAASNNMAKSIYAFSFSDRSVRRQSCLLLVGLAIVGLLPLITWL
ncbi:MgtC/SapB family protein [Alkalinema pantanalense CENA528]|uniref:MgtC/SapB family protein n=1 Tax=Alkalinema pantanalense TaxID=1620705 RepID=UPI003D6DBDB9